MVNGGVLKLREAVYSAEPVCPLATDTGKVAKVISPVRLGDKSCNPSVAG